MLQLIIPDSDELWDEKKEEFVYRKGQTLQLEHSLVSLAKWESKWCVPFLSKKDKTLEELTLDEFKGYSALFENDIYDAIDLVKCCEGRTSYGGPSEASVNNQIALANAQLDAWEEKNA